MSEAYSHDQPVQAWIDKAEHDLIAAVELLKLGTVCPFDIVCFHAQQCAEKYIKALLVSRSVDFPRTHDLRALLQIVPADVVLAIDIEEVVRLTRYVIEGRYPGDWDAIDRPEADRCLAAARAVRAFVQTLLPGSRHERVETN
jgi:HEPN domain-containing protein